MLESHQLRRISSAPAELTSASLTSGTESTKAVDWIRQTRGDGQEHQEIVASSSAPTQRDMLRNLVLEHSKSADQPDEQSTASSSAPGQDTFGAVRHFQQECCEHADTLRAPHDRAISRDSNSSEGRPLTTRDLRRIEEGMGRTVREELDRRDNKPHTWREWANSDWNTIVSTGGAGLGVLGVAAFVYTYRPDLIPHH